MNGTRQEHGRQGGALLEAALRYYRRGWSIIPIKGGTKKPACRSWKRYQSSRPTENQLQKWFDNKKDYGLAVVLEEVLRSLQRRAKK